MPAADAGRFVALIRAIMIGRDGLDRLTVLEIFRAAGAFDPVSHLATGNVSFTADPESVDLVVGRVERAIEQVAGSLKPLYVRSIDDMRSIVASRPFDPSPLAGSVDHEVIFFRGDPPPVTLPVQAPSALLTIFAAGKREWFSAAAPGPDGRVEAPGGLVERLTGERVTVRAWTTVRRIVDAGGPTARANPEH